MGLVTCADADVLRGHIIMPACGAWLAEVYLEMLTPPSGSVTIAAAGGLSLSGTVLTSGVEADTAHVRVVGGAGGLSKEVAGAFQSAQLRDPLDAIMRTSGESLDATSTPSLLSLSLARWTLGRCTARRALDALIGIARVTLGADVNWRMLSSGKIWMGIESWPTAQLPDSAVIVEIWPIEKRTVIAVETPALLPGVDLEGVGRVRAVDHWIASDMVRSWAWT